MSRTPTSRRLKSGVAVVAAAALFALAACSGSKTATAPVAASESSQLPSATTGSMTSPNSLPTTATSHPDQELVAALRSFWDLYLQLGARTGPFNARETRARLGQRTSGRELTELYAVLQGNAAARFVVKGTIDIAPKVESIAGRTAFVHDCYDDETGLYRIADGKRVDTNDPRRHGVLVTLNRANGVWKVAAIKDDGLGCAV